MRARKDAANSDRDDEYVLINMKGKNCSSEQNKRTKGSRGEEATKTLIPEFSAAQVY